MVDVHERFPGTVKIMLTGQADPEAVDNARQNADLFAYLRKPWTEEALVARVNEALAKLGFQRLRLTAC